MKCILMLAFIHSQRPYLESVCQFHDFMVYIKNPVKSRLEQLCLVFKCTWMWASTSDYSKVQWSSLAHWPLVNISRNRAQHHNKLQVFKRRRGIQVIMDAIVKSRKTTHALIIIYYFCQHQTYKRIGGAVALYNDGAADKLNKMNEFMNKT